MPTNVNVTPGSTSVARFGDVVGWFETDRNGGGPLVPQVLSVLRSISLGAFPGRDLGQHLAAALTAGQADAVPALAVAVPISGGVHVVVHGWGSVVAEGVRMPHGWVDELMSDRDELWIGRNTATPARPDPSHPLRLEEGVVPGDGAAISFR